MYNAANHPAQSVVHRPKGRRFHQKATRAHRIWNRYNDRSSTAEDQKNRRVFLTTEV
jgi:hypothetical protein